MSKPRVSASDAAADRLQNFRELVALNKEAEDQCKRLKDKMLAMSKSMPCKTMCKHVLVNTPLGFRLLIVLPQCYLSERAKHNVCALRTLMEWRPFVFLRVAVALSSWLHLRVSDCRFFV